MGATPGGSRTAEAARILSGSDPDRGMMNGLSRPFPSRAVASDQIEIGGLRIAYRRAGTGPPLVLLHGGACDGRVWLRQLEDLSDEFTVAAWDAPGCGQSSDPPETFRMDDYADCLAAFIGALGLKRPHVLGHSFGGGLALALYGRHPAVPRSLTLAGAYAGWAGSLPPEEVARRLRATLEMAEGDPGTPGERPSTGLPDQPVTPRLPGDGVAAGADLHPAGIRVMALAFAEADLRPVLPMIDVPTLLLHGEADERAPRRVADDLHRGIRGSQLVMLPGVGHEIHLEAPGEFNARVRPFLRSIQG